MSKKISIRLFQLFIVIFISLGIGYLLGNYRISAQWKDYRPIISIRNQNPPPATELDMRLFYDVVERINSDYYDKSKIDGDKMVHGAIAGMLQSLSDPYTSFFPPKENENFKTQLAGEFSGIGAELSVNDQNQVEVISPLDGSPAIKAGIRSGDVIIRVDGKSTAGWTISQAVENIRGPKGTKVTLSVLHEHEKNPTDITITRDTIQIKSVNSWLKQFNCTGNNCAPTTNCSTCASVAYIRVSQFGDKTNDEWLSVVNSLVPQIERERNFKGIILDVRNNPGGYLNDAVYIASEFIKDGTVVIQEDGNGRQEPLKVNRRGVLLDQPLVVLVNKGSASASEILAGALRDYERAELIGETTFGKGTIQQAADIDGGGSVHISIAKWLTPDGNWVHEKGLTPDIEVQFDATASSKLQENLDNQIIRAVQELVR